jgi:predicted nucleotide-binding protein
MKQFLGTVQELQAAVATCGIPGVWQDSNNGQCHTYRGKAGEVLNWWPAKGTLQFQGKNMDSFRAKLSAASSDESPPSPTAGPPEAKIFIVHGHDREARDQLELILMRLGLTPFILQNADGGSKTIIEALEHHICRDAAFGIVLLTPDDYGYSKTADDADRQPRARQNVILEMGMLMAALSRSRMVILKKGALEMPSDAAGILYIEFNDHVREVAPKLAQRLQAAGYAIDAQKITAAAA